MKPTFSMPISFCASSLMLLSSQVPSYFMAALPVRNAAVAASGSTELKPSPKKPLSAMSCSAAAPAT